MLAAQTRQHEQALTQQGEAHARQLEELSSSLEQHKAVSTQYRVHVQKSIGEAGQAVKVRWCEACGSLPTFSWRQMAVCHGKHVVCIVMHRSSWAR